MRLSRRGWASALAGLLLVALGLLLQRSILLVGGAVVGAGLLADALVFVRQLETALEGLTVDQRPERDGVVADRPLAVTLRASLDEPSPFQLTIESRPPASTTGVDPELGRLTIPPGGERVEATALASWPHAGTVKFRAPRVTAHDRLGLFEQSFGAGPTPSVTVAPPGPREIHVGVGGEPITAGYGEHEAGRRGAGLKPAELREYVPGDAATRIDWKATARLDEAYVREFEVETDRRTALIFDHRAPLARGPEGETALDYLREVALAYVGSARAFDDPLGCYTVGDDGITGRWLPSADRDQYASIDRYLGGLEPTTTLSTHHPTNRTGPDSARRLAASLEIDRSTFARTLEPYFATAKPYVERIECEPLYRTVRSARETLQGALWTVLFTDDTDPAAVRQAVSSAQRGEGRVVVYLTPSALFEPGGLGDLDRAYEDYVAFEEFRRELSRPNGVMAYEVAPGDRLEAVLSAGKRHRRRPTAMGGA
jgi:uncharacterized protein (DUF58 family)